MILIWRQKKLFKINHLAWPLTNFPKFAYNSYIHWKIPDRTNISDKTSSTDTAKPLILNDFLAPKLAIIRDKIETFEQKKLFKINHLAMTLDRGLKNC